MCLLSALRFRNITTHNPFEVGIALPRDARAPRLDHPPLRIFRFSDPPWSEGIWHYARICRVANVMLPYLEAIGQ